MANLVHKDYKPIRQKPFCCVPTTLQMVFNRHGLPLPGSQKAIGQRLGLTKSARGTRLELPEYDMNNAFRDWNIPLKVRFHFRNKFKNAASLDRTLSRSLQNKKQDCILCVGDLSYGHVLLLNGKKGKDFSFIDPMDAKTHEESIGRIFKALRPSAAYGGVWLISPT